MTSSYCMPSHAIACQGFLCRSEDYFCRIEAFTFDASIYAYSYKLLELLKDYFEGNLYATSGKATQRLRRVFSLISKTKIWLEIPHRIVVQHFHRKSMQFTVKLGFDQRDQNWSDFLYNGHIRFHATICNYMHGYFQQIWGLICRFEASKFDALRLGSPYP